MQGRQLSLGECQFVFERLWHATMECQGVQHLAADAHVDHHHSAESDKVYVKDLHHVLEIAGRLLHKEEIHDDDTQPCTTFMKYSEINPLKNNQRYVPVNLMSRVLLEIFICRKDEVREDVIEKIQKWSGASENK